MTARFLRSTVVQFSTTVPAVVRFVITLSLLLSLGSFLAHPVAAAVNRDSASPKALRLPSSIFPPKSVVQGVSFGNGKADSASRLHTQPFAQLKRQTGYLQTAWWWLVSGGRTASQPLTFQLLSSLFPTAGDATSAYADAQASLWEAGHPTTQRVDGESVFALNERDGHQDAYLTLQRGSIEIELRMRYEHSDNPQVVRTGLWYLGRIGRAIRQKADRFTGTPPPPAPPAAQGPLPPIYTAPWGTGPVVTSPSLLTPTTDAVSPATQLRPGSFRPFGGPPLAPQAVEHARLIPPDGLSRYVRTASFAGGGGWYHAVSLFPIPKRAADAFTSLQASNGRRSWLLPFHLDPTLWTEGHLAHVDAATAWQMEAEIIVAVRVQNVIIILAEIGQQPSSMAMLMDRTVTALPTWIHAQGTDLVTAAGYPVRLRALNWYGAEQQDFVVGGLDFQPYETILQTIKGLGYNCLRLPFSNQLVEQNPVVTAHLAANPELQGLHALEILDRIIGYAGALGLSVILDNHRSDAGWSAQESGLWYTPDYPDAAFDRDWWTLAQHYAVNNVVIGADLRNEPHGPVTWGDGNAATDWLAAAERVGNGILAANPHLLIIVEGIQYYGTTPGYWWGGNLLGVTTSPVVLRFADGTSARSQLVYSAHDYGPDNCSARCPWFNATTSYDSLAQTWEQYWGFITANPQAPYAAPVWLGEFGTCNYQHTCITDTTPGSQGQWFSSLLRYIADKNLGWAYWAANGTQSTAPSRAYGALDWYGFFDRTWTTVNPDLATALPGIQAGNLTNPPPA